MSFLLRQDKCTQSGLLQDLCEGESIRQKCDLYYYISRILLTEIQVLTLSCLIVVECQISV